MTAVGYSPANYGDYVFPGYAEALGWLMVCSPIVLIVAGFIIQSIRYGVSISKVNNLSSFVFRVL